MLSLAVGIHEAFELVGHHLGQHEQRIERLESKPPVQPSVTVINAGSPSKEEEVNRTQFIFWVLTAIAILGCMLAQQSVNVQRTYQIQQEVRQ